LKLFNLSNEFGRFQLFGQHSLAYFHYVLKLASDEELTSLALLPAYKYANLGIRIGTAKYKKYLFQGDSSMVERKCPRHLNWKCSARNTNSPFGGRSTLIPCPRPSTSAGFGTKAEEDLCL
jgi:hypothetical protein